MVDLINQYPQNPSYPYRQPTQSPKQGMNKKILYILLIVAVVSMVSLVVVLMTKTPSKPALCGDNKCEAGENCFDCAVDCKCQSGEYCSEGSKKCVKPVCGNGKCEIFENNLNCCEDCSCIGELETCNKETHACEIPKIAISNEKVKQLAEQYYTNKGKVVKEVGNISDIIYQGKPMKSILVSIEGESKNYYVGITQSEEVIELPFY